MEIVRSTLGSVGVITSAEFNGPNNFWNYSIDWTVLGTGEKCAWWEDDEGLESLNKFAADISPDINYEQLLRHTLREWNSYWGNNTITEIELKKYWRIHNE